MERHGPVHAALCGRLLGGHELLSSAVRQCKPAAEGGSQWISAMDFSSAQGQKAAGRAEEPGRSDQIAPRLVDFEALKLS